VTTKALITIATRLLMLAKVRTGEGDFKRAADAARTAARLLTNANAGGL
jgi:hypothetical protein